MFSFSSLDPTRTIAFHFPLKHKVSIRMDSIQVVQEVARCVLSMFYVYPHIICEYIAEPFLWLKHGRLQVNLYSVFRVFVLSATSDACLDPKKPPPSHTHTFTWFELTLLFDSPRLIPTIIGPPKNKQTHSLSNSLLLTWSVVSKNICNL